MFIKPRVNRALIRWVRALLVTLLALQAAACVTGEGTESRLARGREIAASQQDSDKFQEAMGYFRSAEYGQALALFEELSRNAGTEPLRRKALYAQGCTRLILAQTTEEYNSALALWQSWSRLAPSENGEDPRMLTPILERISPTLPPELKGAPISQPLKPRKKGGSVYVNKDLATYKSALESREKELERYRTRLESREREVRRLKQQIESLEAIHLKFQEKQKEVSSP